jgi:hypothetical protein
VRFVCLPFIVVLRWWNPILLDWTLLGEFGTADRRNYFTFHSQQQQQQQQQASSG